MEGGFLRISVSNFLTFVLIEISSLRGASSFNALRNFLTSFIYCLCRSLKYSVLLFFFIQHEFTDSHGTQFFIVIQTIYHQ